VASCAWAAGVMKEALATLASNRKRAIILVPFSGGPVVVDRGVSGGPVKACIFRVTLNSAAHPLAAWVMMTR